MIARFPPLGAFNRLSVAVEWWWRLLCRCAAGDCGSGGDSSALRGVSRSGVAVRRDTARFNRFIDAVAEVEMGLSHVAVSMREVSIDAAARVRQPPVLPASLLAEWDRLAEDFGKLRVLFPAAEDSAS